MAIRDALQGLGLGSGFGIIADLLVTGGDTLFFLATVLIDQAPLLFVLLSRLLAAAPNVDWLPAQRLELVFTAVALFLAALVLYRLLTNLSNRFQQRYDT